MIITISGYAGSGKSTVGEEIARRLKYKYYCIGDLRRKTAEEKGMTLAEYNKLGEIDKTTDTDVDEYAEKLGKTEDNFVMVGRTAFHFIPNSFKVFLAVDIDEATKRILKSNFERTTEKFSNFNKAKEKIKERDESDRRRYVKYYNLDILNKNHYDLWLDTTNMTIEEVIDKMIKHLNEKKYLC